MSDDVGAALAALPELAEVEQDQGILWVAPRPLGGRAAGLLQSMWHVSFESIYGQPPAPDEAGLHPAVWGDSHGGGTLPIGQIRAWIDHTVANVLALRPRRVLEIGCGDGQILRGLLPHCQSYLGTDLSQAALDGLAASLPAADAGRVELVCLAADQLAQLAGPFDTVVMNSVCQYFPSFEHLEGVLEGIGPLLAPGGALYLGDVRCLRARLELAGSIAWTRRPELTAGQWRAEVRQRLVEQQELLLDPALAFALASRWGRAELSVKRGHEPDELTRFRFDLVAWNDGATPAATPEVLEWDAAGGLTGLEGRLRGHAAGWLVVRDVPNARLAATVERFQRLSEAPDDRPLAEVTVPEPVAAVHPEDLHELGRALDRRVIAGFGGRAGCQDVFFGKPSAAPPQVCGVLPINPPPPLANLPGFARLAARLRQRVEQALAARSLSLAVRVLERLPRTADGRLDAAAARTAWVAA